MEGGTTHNEKKSPYRILVKLKCIFINECIQIIHMCIYIYEYFFSIPCYQYKSFQSVTNRSR